MPPGTVPWTVIVPAGDRDACHSPAGMLDGGDGEGREVGGRWAATLDGREVGGDAGWAGDD